MERQIETVDDLGRALADPEASELLITGTLGGLYPAWRSSRLNPSLALQAG